MKIPITLNNEKYILEAEPSEKLLHVLRREKLVSVKHGCQTASCGACQVLLDGKAVASCHIPVGIVMDSNIITLEYFSKTEFYSEIMRGFEKAGISLCGYCNAGKIFLTYEIINTMTQPTREKIAAITNKLNDCCVEQDILINGILYAYAIHYEKGKLRKNGN